MNEQKFKTEYQRSENSVPVNTELKKKLIEMAREYEKSETVVPDITISHTARKKRIRKIITELSAIAACAALCIYTIPKINNQYLEHSDGIEPVISTEEPIPVDYEPEKPSADYSIPTADTKTEPVTSDRSSITKPAKSNNNDIKTTESMPTYDVTEHHTPNTDTTNKGRAGYTSPDDNFEHSKSELDARLDAITRNNKKLEDWNDTLIQYKSNDDIISGYYESFSQSASKYAAAVEDFEKSYGSANDSGQVYEGIEKYDTELDGILFETCRADYRKAKNYIEMNLADYALDEAHETDEPELPEESELMEGAE